MSQRVWQAMLVGTMCFALGLPLGGGSASAAPASTTDTGSTEASSTRTATTLTATEFEIRLLKKLNARRDKRGCRRFKVHDALVRAAREHSTRMARSGELSHRLTGEGDLATRLTSAGYTNWRILAENLAWGQASPRAVKRAWVRSADHRANLDNCRLRDAGIGVVVLHGRPWVTADFGRRWR